MKITRLLAALAFALVTATAHADYTVPALGIDRTVPTASPVCIMSGATCKVQIGVANTMTGVWTVPGSAILPPIAAGTILGNSTGSSAVPQALTTLPSGLTIPSPNLTGSPLLGGVPFAPSATIDTTNASNISSGALLRGRLAGSLPCESIDSHGGNPNGIADNTTAFAASIAVGSCVEFGSGNYYFSGPVSYTVLAFGSLVVKGQGPENTHLTFASGASGFSISYSSYTSSSHFRDMSILSAGVGTPTPTTGITLTSLIAISNPANFAASDIVNVSFRGNDGFAQTNYWTTNIDIESVSDVNISASIITGPQPALAGPYTLVGTGVKVHGVAGSEAVSINISNCFINYVGDGVLFTPYVQGLTITSSNFTGGNIGVHMSDLFGATQLNITNSQFNVADSGVKLGEVPDVMIANNLFLIPANGYGVNLVNESIATIVGNNFDVPSSPKTGQIGIYVGAAGYKPAMAIADNVFRSMATGISLTVASTAIGIKNNKYVDNVTNIANFGLGNYSDEFVIGGGLPASLSGYTWTDINHLFNFANLGIFGIGWNFSSGDGETSVMMNHGVAHGGIAFYDVPNTLGAITKLLYIDPTVGVMSYIPLDPKAGIIGPVAGAAPGAGLLGQEIESSIPSGSAVALTSGVTADIASVNLTAGNWLCYANISSNPAGGTSTTTLTASISNASATIPALPNDGAGIVDSLAGSPAGFAVTHSVGQRIYRTASPITVYLVSAANFSGGTLGAYGYLGCLRQP